MMCDLDTVTVTDVTDCVCCMTSGDIDLTLQLVDAAAGALNYHSLNNTGVCVCLSVCAFSLLVRVPRTDMHAY